jgi:hypothetical protein
MSTAAERQVAFREVLSPMEIASLSVCSSNQSYHSQAVEAHRVVRRRGSHTF